MGATFARVKVWVSGEILTASDLNGEIDNVLDNLTPAGIDDASADLTAMRAVTDPYPGGSESLATSSEGELERLRYLFSQRNKTSQWYIFPDLVTIINTDSPYTASVDEEIIIADTTSGSITVNLPAISGLKDSKKYIIVKSASANTVTIDGNAAETIDGSATRTITSQYDSVIIVHDGTEWFTVKSGGVTGGDSHDHSNGDGAKIPQDGIEDYAAGTTTLISGVAEKSTTNTAYTLAGSYVVTRAGTIRVKFELHIDVAGNTAYGRIYKNGAPFGTEQTTTSASYVEFSEDLAVSPQDSIELYYKAAAGFRAYERNFILYVDKYLVETVTAA